MTHVYVYTELDLRKLKGQALKDVWHAMIGKPAGLKNTTGLKNSEEIIEAILRKQEETRKVPGLEIVSPPIEAEMPPKAKPQPQPQPQAKKKEVKTNKLLAIESTEAPLEGMDVVRIAVQKRTIDGQDYYVETGTNKVYAIRTGDQVGIWNPESKAIE